MSSLYKENSIRFFDEVQQSLSREQNKFDSSLQELTEPAPAATEDSYQSLQEEEFSTLLASDTTTAQPPSEANFDLSPTDTQKEEQLQAIKTQDKEESKKESFDWDPSKLTTPAPPSTPPTKKMGKQAVDDFLSQLKNTGNNQNDGKQTEAVEVPFDALTHETTKGPSATTNISVTETIKENKEDEEDFKEKDANAKVSKSGISFLGSPQVQTNNLDEPLLSNENIKRQRSRKTDQRISRILDQKSRQANIFQRVRQKKIWVAASIALFLVGGTLWLGEWRKQIAAEDLYEKGLRILTAHTETLQNLRKNAQQAEEIFQQATRLEKPKPPSIEYMRLYGTAYQENGFILQAFYKLFGETSPIPTFAKGLPLQIEPLNNANEFIDQFDQLYLVKKPGAYLQEMFQYGQASSPTLIQLAKFHSNPSRMFQKNDVYNFHNIPLAQSYLSQIFQQEANHPEALLVQVDILVNSSRDFEQAIAICDRILSKNPQSISAAIKKIEIRLAQLQYQPRNENSEFLVNHIWKLHDKVRENGWSNQFPVSLQKKLLTFYEERINSTRNSFTVDRQEIGIRMKNLSTQLLEEELLRKIDMGDQQQNLTNRNKATAMYYLGVYWYSVKGDTKKGIQYWDKSLQFQKEYYPSLMRKGYLEKKIGRLEDSRISFQKAIQFYRNLQNSPRDEDQNLLTQHPISSSYFHLGEIALLEFTRTPISSFDSSQIQSSKIIKRYPLSSTNLNQRQQQLEIALLKRADRFFDQAIKLNLKNPKFRDQTTYWRGWIQYMMNNYSQALKNWLSLDTTHPVLDVAMGNAFYHQGNYQTALEFFFQANDHLNAALTDSAAKVNLNNHQTHALLAAVSNNIGATFQKLQQTNLPTQSLQYYYRALEYSALISELNEFAQSNILRKSRNPSLDDWIPLQIYIPPSI